VSNAGADRSAGRAGGVGFATGFHPSTPFEVGPEGKGEDEEGEDGDEDLHEGRGLQLENRRSPSKYEE